MPNADGRGALGEAPRSALGVALSGGGSRAAAFHRGTVLGLEEVGLLDKVDVVSSVSGGSVFAAAWMAAISQGRDLRRFLADIGLELARGFIARSFSFSAVKLALPSYTRANLLAETFDRTLTAGIRLKDLPEKLLLCINTSVMNTGQVGRFSRDGFSSTGFHAPGAGKGSSNATVPLPEFPLALAATASAAFRWAYRPCSSFAGNTYLKAGDGPCLAGHSRFALTDGGVLENLGVQTLLKSRRFGAWDFVLNDAGRTGRPWKPGGVMNSLRGAVLGAVGLPTIERVMTMMNGKENRHMRFTAYGEMERTWLIEALRDGATGSGLDDFLLRHRAAPRRKILLVRLTQTLTDILTAIRRWRLCELASRVNQIVPDRLPPIKQLFLQYGIDLAPALDIPCRNGGRCPDRGAESDRRAFQCSIAGGYRRALRPCPLAGPRAGAALLGLVGRWVSSPEGRSTI